MPYKDVEDRRANARYYYAMNHKKCRKYQNQYRKENLERAREWAKKHREKDREKYNLKQRLWYAKKVGKPIDEDFLYHYHDAPKIKTNKSKGKHPWKM